MAAAPRQLLSSFPSSAWERTSRKLRFLSVRPAKRSFAPGRSQAELGNEENEESSCGALLLLRQAPQAQDAVVAARERPAAVRRNGNDPDRLRVAAEHVQFLARIDVPEAHGQVEAGGDGPLAVGGQGHAPDLLRVAVEAFQLLAGLGVPEAHRLVPAARQEAASVAGDGHARHALRVAGKLAHLAP